MDFTVWLTFVAATMALLLIPGPTVLLVLSYAIGHGRRVAMSTAFGVALGDFAAMTAFFVAFVPQFIDPAAALLPQFAIFIGTFVGLAGVNALIYEVLAVQMRDVIGKPRVIALLTRAGGVALILMGVATATLRRS